MEIDTGVTVTIMSKVPNVEQSEDMLSTYTGEKITIYGTVHVCVSAKGKSTELPLTMVSGSCPTLLGRNWINSIHLDWLMITTLQLRSTHICLRSTVKCLTPVKSIEAKIHIPSDAKP